ncbi:MAG TPA: hypothetical protein VFM14_01260 [Gemmatimonadales bacterium]|nr:hypothetical protein [Gemmatimonadales bacterium]
MPSLRSSSISLLLRFLIVELATLTGVSERTIQPDWRKARLLLHGTLQD